MDSTSSLQNGDEFFECDCGVKLFSILMKTTDVKLTFILQCNLCHARYGFDFATPGKAILIKAEPLYVSNS